MVNGGPWPSMQQRFLVRQELKPWGISPYPISGPWRRVFNGICQDDPQYKPESMDPNSSLIEAREIAETIEHLSAQLKPDVIRAARKDKEGRLYLDRIEYALGTIGKALILTDYTIDEEKDIDKLEAFRESQQHIN